MTDRRSAERRLMIGQGHIQGCLHSPTVVIKPVPGGPPQRKASSPGTMDVNYLRVWRRREWRQTKALHLPPAVALPRLSKLLVMVIMVLQPAHGVDPIIDGHAAAQDPPPLDQLPRGRVRHDTTSFVRSFSGAVSWATQGRRRPRFVACFWRITAF